MLGQPPSTEASMDDSVARDAKRLLLRYGAPIAVVDRLSDEERISLSRPLVRTALGDRPAKLREMLSAGGWLATSRSRKLESAYRGPGSVGPGLRRGQPVLRAPRPGERAERGRARGGARGGREERPPG